MNLPTLTLVAALWLLDRQAPARRETLQEALGCPPRTARKVLRRLEQLGVVQREGAGEFTRWRPVALEDAAQQVLVKLRGAA